MHLVALFLLGAVIGAWLGQFAATLVSRREAVRAVGWRRALAPPAHCDACRAPLAAIDTIPIVSWMLLGGRARCCGAPVSVYYLLAEWLGFALGGGALLGLLLA